MLQLKRFELALNRIFNAETDEIYFPETYKTCNLGTLRQAF